MKWTNIVHEIVSNEADISINSKRYTLPGHKDYNIFILLGRNYLELAIADTNNLRVEGLQYYYTGSKNLGKKHAVKVFDGDLVKGAQNIYVGVDSHKSTLLPEKLFNESRAQEILSTQYTIEENELVQADNSSSLANIYAIKKGTEKLILDYMPSAQIMHSTAGLLKVYPALASASEQIFISCRDQYIFITYYKERKLQLHHQYDILKLEDAVYHTLNLIQSKGLKLQKTVVMLHGESKLTSMLYRALEVQEIDVRYISRVRLNDLSFNEQILELPTYQFFNLFSLVSCV